MESIDWLCGRHSDSDACFAPFSARQERPLADRACGRRQVIVAPHWDNTLILEDAV